MDHRYSALSGAGLIAFPLLLTIILRSLGTGFAENLPGAATACVFSVIVALLAATVVCGFFVVVMLIAGSDSGAR